MQPGCRFLPFLAKMPKHYQHNGEAVDAVNENWPAVTCMSGKCTGAASNMWAPAAAAVASGLSIGMFGEVSFPLLSSWLGVFVWRPRWPR